MSFEPGRPSRLGSPHHDETSMAGLLHDVRRIRNGVRSKSAPPEHVLADLLVHQAQVRAESRVRTQGWEGVLRWAGGSRLWGQVTAMVALGLLLVGGGWLEGGTDPEMRSPGGMVVDSLFGGPARGEQFAPQDNPAIDSSARGGTKDGLRESTPRTVEFADSMAASETTLDPVRQSYEK